MGVFPWFCWIYTGNQESLLRHYAPLRLWTCRALRLTPGKAEAPPDVVPELHKGSSRLPRPRSPAGRAPSRCSSKHLLLTEPGCGFRVVRLKSEFQHHRKPPGIRVWLSWKLSRDQSWPPRRCSTRNRGLPTRSVGCLRSLWSRHSWHTQWDVLCAETHGFVGAQIPECTSASAAAGATFPDCPPCFSVRSWHFWTRPVLKFAVVPSWACRTQEASPHVVTYLKDNPLYRFSIWRLINCILP